MWASFNFSFGARASCDDPEQLYSGDDNSRLGRFEFPVRVATGTRRQGLDLARRLRDEMVVAWRKSTKFPIRPEKPRILLGEAAGSEWGNVDRRGSAGDEVRDHLAGHRRRGHPDMAVAEGVDHVRGGARWADHRQRVGKARPMAHPYRDPLLRMGGGEAGQHLAALLEQDAGAPPVGRRFEARE